MTDEHQLMGSSSYGVGLGDWVVTAPDHWLFAGTRMKAGDRIPRLVGWEYHGPPLRDDPTLVVVASAKVFNNAGVEQLPSFAAVVYDGPKGTSSSTPAPAGGTWCSPRRPGSRTRPDVTSRATIRASSRSRRT